jgi:RNA polymerase sigma-70 factor, ECF subfamily
MVMRLGAATGQGRDRADDSWSTADDLASFCRAEWPRLVGTLTLYCGDRAVAEELAQETLVRVWRHWADVERATNPQAWAHRVALNLASSWFRSGRARRRALQRAERAATPHRDPDPADAVAVRAAVSALPERQCRALILRYFADLSVREVAELMGCRDGTVKALTSQAIEALRSAGLEVTE